MLTEWLIEFKQRDKRRLTFREFRDKQDRKRQKLRPTQKSYLF